MKFEKWHALGNDYVIIEATDLPEELTPALLAGLGFVVVAFAGSRARRWMREDEAPRVARGKPWPVHAALAAAVIALFGTPLCFLGGTIVGFDMIGFGAPLAGTVAAVVGAVALGSGREGKGEPGAAIVVGLASWYWPCIANLIAAPK